MTGPKLNRRGFLTALFGATVVAAAGPIPATLEKLSDNEFKATIKSALDAIMPRNDEVYGNSSGDYAFARLEWITEPPFMRVTIPEGFRPLREESDRIGREAIKRMLGHDDDHD